MSNAQYTVSEFPGRPQTRKGAFVTYDDDSSNQPSKIIVFQYNADSIRRSFANRTDQRPTHDVGAAREDVLRVLGPPVETINITLEMHAADQLAVAQPGADVIVYGLYPILSALEMLLYPPSTRVKQIQQAGTAGRVDVTPADVPLTLLVWGNSRAAPVMLTSFSVTEEAFDATLNPIFAKVEVGMRVLTYMEFAPNTLGMRAYIAYQGTKETLADKATNAPGQDDPVRQIASSATANQTPQS